jgi:ubiquinone/menaquinone biosynthesis C-methylase UbiE
MKTREKIVPLAFGNFLQVGMGFVINMDLYKPDQVTKVWALEPSKKNLAKSPVQV